ncbi:caspase-9-like [Watersipora subatra]|uniref:caspase-9-like n=1 Tax=Watersipora subatra TaxID=2589382 RepID=UPI00355B7215
MSEPVRGRVLIINNMNFRYGHGNRAGSQFDYRNLSMMFKDLKFDIAKSQAELTDLRAQDIYREIQIETAREEHKNLGMFVLVIMTHGTSGNHLLDIEGNMIPLIHIQDLLSPRNFPAMKGKPKLMILQACSGGRRDFGESRELLPSPISTITSSPTTESTTVSSTSVPQSTTVSSTSAPQSTTVNSTSAPQSPTISVPPPTTLNADDFFIMKASSESYMATKSCSHGAWFIRVLVATFYKHSSHRDIESLFKIIQSRVRQVSMADQNARSCDTQGGNVPTSSCTFTKLRKLYLFPGFRKDKD